MNQRGKKILVNILRLRKKIQDCREDEDFMEDFIDEEEVKIIRLFDEVIFGHTKKMIDFLEAIQKVDVKFASRLKLREVEDENELLDIHYTQLP